MVGIQNFTGNLANKLILAFTLTVFLIIGTLSFLSYRNTLKILETNFISGNRHNIKLVNRNFEAYLKQIDDLSLTPRKSESLMYALESQTYDLATQLTIEDQLKNIFYSHPDIENIRFFIPGEHKLYSISRKDSIMGVKIRDDDSTQDQEWYRRASHDPKHHDIESLLKLDLLSARAREITNIETDFLIFHRLIINISNNRPLAAISFTLNGIQRDKLLNDIMGETGEIVTIFDGRNIPFYISDLHIINNGKWSYLKRISETKPEGHFFWKESRKRYLIIYNVSASDGWKFIKIIPTYILNKKANDSLRWGFLIGGIFLIGSILLVMLIANAITDPLKKLSRQMEKVGAGDFHVQLEIAGNDEIAYLADKFNWMVGKINELINDEYKAKISEKNARLQALEAQINPHFLYNALQAISTKAIFHGTKDISQMIDALASTLRYCFKGSDMVTMEQELAHIQNYLILQKARFGERLNVDFDMDPVILRLNIPKLTIQTLIENSIGHGLEQITGPIRIIIVGKLGDGNVMIKVTDDGPGITADRLAQVIQEFQEPNSVTAYSQSIGLKNIFTRLKLIFGDSASLIIANRPEGGTVVSLIIPVKEVI